MELVLWTGGGIYLALLVSALLWWRGTDRVRVFNAVTKSASVLLPLCLGLGLYFATRELESRPLLQWAIGGHFNLFSVPLALTVSGGFAFVHALAYASRTRARRSLIYGLLFAFILISPFLPWLSREVSQLMFRERVQALRSRATLSIQACCRGEARGCVQAAGSFNEISQRMGYPPREIALYHKYMGLGCALRDAQACRGLAIALGDRALEFKPGACDLNDVAF